MLFQLPYLVCNDVFRQMAIDHLFLLSFASKRTKNLIKAHMAQKSTTFGLDATEDKEQRLMIKKGNSYKTIIRWTYRKAPRKLKNIPPVVFEMCGERVECSLGFDSKTWSAALFCDISMKEMLCSLLFAHASDVFGKPNCLVLTMEYDTFPDVPKSLEIENIRIFEKNTGYYEHIILSKTVNSLFGTMKVTDCALIYPATFGFSPNSPLLSIKNIGIQSLRGGLSAPLLSQEYLMNFKAVNAVFGTRLGNPDVIGFLKHWKSGQNLTLESMIVKTDSEISRDLILAGFEMKPWDVKRHPAEFEYNEKLKQFLLLTDRNYVFDSDCSGHMDIEREADGMLATVIITPNEFKFFVWKNTGRV